MITFIKTLVLYLENVLETFTKCEISDSINQEELSRMKYFFIYKPLFKDFKQFKTQSKKNDYTIQEFNNKDKKKLSNSVVELVTICKQMLSSIIKDEINENLSEYDLETYYNKYIDYDSFFEILSDYGFFGDEISDNEDIDDIEMKD
ncbi:uncharacterized protein METZ01_LOCUS80429 [marine metagenome]|uniref:Uncharacterized protein n=1 Tax=marine metagenome TaxID=408172 RepID=A0A381UHC7_9ZZZZ|tara:strand:- start:18082 stop:18522 length:441 start_codon:yes stop_codon:yes gene_type:complete